MGPDSHERAEEDRARQRRALLALTVIVGAMLVLPALLHSVAPEEPLKDGIVVFADGKQRAYFLDPRPYDAAGYRDACFVEAAESLVILEIAPVGRDGALLARVEGRRTTEFPFCPPQAAILIKPHQLMRKAPLWEEFRQVLVRAINR